MKEQIQGDYPGSAAEQ